MKITIKDNVGNIIEKEIDFIWCKRSNKMIISFGWPCEYYANNLIKHYPYEKPLCIDMGGRNHKGSPVDIPPQVMDEIIERYIEEIFSGVL